MWTAAPRAIVSDGSSCKRKQVNGKECCYIPREQQLLDFKLRLEGKVFRVPKQRANDHLHADGFEYVRPGLAVGISAIPTRTAALLPQMGGGAIGHFETADTGQGKHASAGQPMVTQQQQQSTAMHSKQQQLMLRRSVQPTARLRPIPPSSAMIVRILPDGANNGFGGAGGGISGRSGGGGSTHTSYRHAANHSSTWIVAGTGNIRTAVPSSYIQTIIPPAFIRTVPSPSTATGSTRTSATTATTTSRASATTIMATPPPPPKNAATGTVTVPKWQQQQRASAEPQQLPTPPASPASPPIDPNYPSPQQLLSTPILSRHHRAQPQAAGEHDTVPIRVPMLGIPINIVGSDSPLESFSAAGTTQETVSTMTHTAGTTQETVSTMTHTAGTTQETVSTMTHTAGTTQKAVRNEDSYRLKARNESKESRVDWAGVEMLPMLTAGPSRSTPATLGGDASPQFSDQIQLLSHALLLPTRSGERAATPHPRHGRASRRGGGGSSSGRTLPTVYDGHLPHRSPSSPSTFAGGYRRTKGRTPVHQPLQGPIAGRRAASAGVRSSCAASLLRPSSTMASSSSFRRRREASPSTGVNVNANVPPHILTLFGPYGQNLPITAL
eukprot:gene1068-29942_t